jgi:CheY-like chemotaxis protein/anti-sigma regulatory factor (Ser/Thr protein kinase)
MDHIYGEVPEKISEVLERVQQCGHHLLDLINDVLDISKMEAGQLTLALSNYSLAEVVQTVFSAVESLAVEKGLALTVALPADLPLGKGDERRLAQVLLNLLGNAIKFTEVGEVQVRATAADGAFTVAVSDTGPGISEADQQRSSRHSSRPTVPLPEKGWYRPQAVDRQAHHRDARWVRLSVAPGEGFHLLIHSAETRRAAEGGDMNTRILVVEDQADNRRILRDLLSSVGYEILEAVTGDEGVTLAATQHPDLILMDIQLPGIDGYEATRRIKADPVLHHIPIIAVTSYALSGRCLALRLAAAPVARPFSPRPPGQGA